MVASARTQVAIVGAGPSGLMLSHLLAQHGIDSVILERQTRSHVLSRIRAGVLEWGSVETIRQAGVGARMDRQGLVHDGFDLAFDGDLLRIDLAKLVGKSVMVYGQTDLTLDLIEAREAAGADIRWNTAVTGFDQLRGECVEVHTDGGRVMAEYVVACDGFHGVGRRAIPQTVQRTYERVYPFGWLGLLADVPPCRDELIYANHTAGFALCSMRSRTRSRYYVQITTEDRVENWSDERFWDSLCERVGPTVAATVVRGPSIEKSIAPLRSFVAEPMRFGRLFLAGDAAHIVPPTGAKGLNMALADVKLLAEAFDLTINHGNASSLEAYSDRALKRVWKVERFSWMMSELLHQFPEHSPFEKRLQRSEFDYLVSSEAAQRTIAENYVGLPI